MGAVVAESLDDSGGWVLEVEMGERDFYRFLKRENLPAEILEQSQAEVSAKVAT